MKYQWKSRRYYVIGIRGRLIQVPGGAYIIKNVHEERCVKHDVAEYFRKDEERLIAKGMLTKNGKLRKTGFGLDVQMGKFSVDQETYEKLQKIKKNTKKSYNYHIRKALDQYLGGL